MPNRKPTRKPIPANLASLAHLAATIHPGSPRTDHQKRQMIANLCRTLANTPVHRSPSPNAQTLKKLSPRMKQTLDGLLSGDSEKQIARNLQISRHTVHIYVKKLYRQFGVCSRGELLARFVHK